MANGRFEFNSDCLRRMVNFHIVLPNDLPKEWTADNPHYKRPMKTLFLLHGYTGNSMDWMTGSAVCELAGNYNLAVVCPAGENSFYLDGPETGRKYATYVGEELVQYVRKTFGLAERMEDTYIGGLSMGGFGAFKAALRNPEKYAAAASLSGGLLMEEAADASPEGVGRYAMLWRQTMFGKDLERIDPHKDHLLVILKDQVEAGANLPALYQCCGTEDFLYESNQRFLREARAMGVEITYEEGSGVHNFDFWDPFIRRVLDWLPLSGGLV